MLIVKVLKEDSKFKLVHYLEDRDNLNKTKRGPDIQNLI